MKQDEKKKVEDCTKQVLGIGINDCPLWLVKWFSQRAKTQFNDCYWACLSDMKTKTESYEMMTTDKHYVSDSVDCGDEEENTVRTFTGPIKDYDREDE